MRLPLLVHVLAFLSVLPPLTFASFLAIDYGTDWIKASLMKPGVTFDVLLNKDSKRKIHASVGWKGTDRLFGTDAFNLASRYPEDSFSSLKYLLAAPYDSDAPSLYATISTATTVQTARKTIALKRSDGTEWSAEELVAMQFAYVRDLAESFAGERVHDAIVTVPAFFSQFHRDAVADAIEIAGLRTLALINDGTAVAVNYAMTRSFPKPETHVIFDAGASSIRATVVSFATPSSDPKGTTITVAGVGYDLSTGGTELNRRLREMLVENFIAKHKRDIRGNKRGMAKLWKESERLKAILSANSEAVATIESLAFDIDFKAKISRDSFERACADLKSKFAQPIMDALINAGMTMNDISSVILTGGSSRTPMIQAAVKAAVGEDKVAQNVNADEAAVLGAAFHGAGLSRQFKTKDIKVVDISIYDIRASYLAAPTSSNAPRTINTLIFPAGTKTGTKKTLTFKRKDDFSVSLDYRQLAPGFPTHILEVEISGVAGALQNLTERGAIDPVVKATAAMSESGFASIRDAIAFGEIKESLAEKLKGLFGGASSDDAESSEPGDPEARQTPLEASSSSPSPPSSSAATENTASASLREMGTIQLDTTVTFSSLLPMAAEEKRAARDRLRELDRDESAKHRKEEARNSLEGYLYRVRDLLDAQNPETPFKKCSQEAERAAIAEKLEETISWLHDKGDLAETSQFYDKRNVIETLEAPIVHRYKEIEAFPQALNQSQMWNWSTRLFLTEAHKNLTEEEEAGLPSKWTKEELLALEKTLKDHERWLSEWVEKQKSVKMNEDPVITTTEMKARVKTLELHLQRLVKRRVPKPRKTSSSTSAAPTNSHGSNMSDDDGLAPPPPPSPPEPTPAVSPSPHEEL